LSMRMADRTSWQLCSHFGPSYLQVTLVQGTEILLVPQANFIYIP